MMLLTFTRGVFKIKEDADAVFIRKECPAMNLRQALYVKTIAEEGGITAAARKLYITQPSLSQMLHQMEEEAGVALFDRSRLPFRPTYAGERYLHAAQVMLNTNEILENELREIRGEARGRLRLGISMQQAAHLLPQVLPEFVQAYPNVEISLHEAGSTRLEQLVQSGTVDLALASAEPVNPHLDYRLIQRQQIGILAGADSALAQRLDSGTPASLEEVRQGPFVALKPGHSVRVVQDRLFQEHGLRPRIFLETDSMEAAREVALRCGCYLLCSDSYLPSGARFYPLKNYENRRHFYACTRKGETVARYAEAFVQMAVAWQHQGAVRSFCK